jgi:exopolysaccharide biosynthesis polyprenyl glycosylphosphotransferase
MTVTEERRVEATELAGSAVMPRRRHWKIVRLLVISDILTVFAATVVSVAAIDLSNEIPYRWAISTVVLTIFLFALEGLYERDHRQISVSALDETKDVLKALGLVGFATFAAAVAFNELWILPPDPLSVVFFWIAGTVLIPTGRAALRHRVIPKSADPQVTIVVGAGKVGQAVARKIRKNPQYNVKVVGFLDDDPETLEEDVADVPILGPERDLLDAIVHYGATRVVLAFSRSTHEEVLELVRTAGLRDVHISIVPRYFEIIAANVAIDDVEGITLLELPVAALSRLALVAKRAFDLALTVPALILLSPFLLLVAIAIRLDSPGPILFRQPRMGRDDQPFEIVKFRTMVDGAEEMRTSLIEENESSGPLFKIREDPRITRVGRVLRRYSIDELPQLWNVVKGQMSLVGPRPFVIYEDDQIAGWARRRLELTPGITGLWQVLGRNDIEFDEMVKLDYLYVTNWSLWWDTKLILRTIPIILGRRGY